MGVLMGLNTRIKNYFIKKIGTRQYQGIVDKEALIADREGAVCATSSSPRRFDIPFEMFKYISSNRAKMLGKTRTFFLMPSMFSNMKKSLTSFNQNPEKPKTHVSEEFLKEFENYAGSLKINTVGYVKLPHELIFKEKAVLHDNAIILAMEMEKEKIELAPSTETAHMIMQTYHELGKASNRLTDFLRDRGYSAHAGHPFGGLVLYPPLARIAGVGWHGKHGLIITAEHGPRVRLTAIYTNIENLPERSSNQHEWIEKFCAKCGRCARKCPGFAFYDSPIIHDNGLITHIDNEKCFPVFLENEGCTVCIKECPFSRLGYNKLKTQFLDNSVDPEII